MNHRHLKIKRGKRPAFPDFKEVEPEDRDMIQAYTSRHMPVSCEYSFANLFCWGSLYDYRWSVFKDMLIIYNGVEKGIFMPLGCMEAGFFELAAISRALINKGLGGNIFLADPGCRVGGNGIDTYYKIRRDEHLAEYIYAAKKLSELRGRKLGKKRNLISQFKNRYPDYRIQKMSPANIDACRAFSDALLLKQGKVDRSIREEKRALDRAFDYFDEIGLEGLVLRVKEMIAAFAVFSPLHPMMYVTHYEKSDIDFKGAAQVINRETADYLKGKCEYINREQDLGIPGLRKAKLSYDPDYIHVPGTLIFKNGRSPNPRERQAGGR